MPSSMPSPSMAAVVELLALTVTGTRLVWGSPFSSRAVTTLTYACAPSSVSAERGTLSALPICWIMMSALAVMPGLMEASGLSMRSSTA